MKKIILSFVALSFTFGVYSQTIVEAAVSNKDFSTLVTALKSADLVGALSGEGPFTVFAPNNDAFAKIDSETLGNLLKPDDPVFEIDFPNTSGTVASEINYRLADPQRSQLQALSLLSQGIFINEVSVSMQGITNNLYQKASDIVSNLIGEENV